MASLTERNFIRNEKLCISNEENRQLGELVKDFKTEYDIAVVRNNGKTKYDAKRRKHVLDLPEKDYVSSAVRTFYKDMKDIKFEDKNFKMACKIASRSFESLTELSDSRAMSGGRKKSAPDVREALFTYFVDIRGSLKARFPKRLLTLKARQLYSDWITQNPLQENERPLKFGNQWVKEWECEYNISLRKRFSIPQEVRIIRVNDYLQNIWSLRQYFIRKYNIDPPVINGDQMPLHRSESSEQKTHF